MVILDVRVRETPDPFGLEDVAVHRSEVLWRDGDSRSVKVRMGRAVPPRGESVYCGPD